MSPVSKESVSSKSQKIDSLNTNGHACERHGYPIFLLRKSAINPKWSTSKIHDSVIPSLDDREPAEKFQDHQSILRPLREGYVYVLGGKSESQKDYISYYQVVEDGILLEKRPEDLEKEKSEPLPETCTVNNHFVPASFITVELNDKLLQKNPYLWIAYSRYPWNKKARNHYKKTTQLARFTKIDLTSFCQSPTSNTRGVELTNWSLPILEFLPNLSGKTQYLPNYKDRKKQQELYANFVSNYESKSGKKVGGIVLEDHLGLLEDLNFQLNVENNFTGDQKLDSKTDKNSELYPYTYNKLFSEEIIHKKTIAELITTYKESTQKHYQDKSEPGDIYVSYPTNISDVWNNKPAYDHTSAEVDDLGNIHYQLSKAGMASYKFDQYWKKLESQLKKGALEQFKQEYDEKFKQLQEQIKESPRDYVLNLRWFLGKQIKTSTYLSGENGKAIALDGAIKDVIYPKQTISRYNEVKFWEIEIDYKDAANHQRKLMDLSYILAGEKNNFYILGVWDEIIRDKKGLIYSAIAGNEKSFWDMLDGEDAANKLADQVFSYLTDNESKAIESMASTILTYMGNALLQMTQYHPSFSYQAGHDIINGTGVRTIFKRDNIHFSEVTAYIKSDNIELLKSKIPSSGTVITPTEVEKTLMLKFFIKGNGEQTKELAEYFNRVNDQNVNLNKLQNKLKSIRACGANEIEVIFAKQTQNKERAKRVINIINQKNQEWMQKKVKSAVNFSKFSGLTIINVFSLIMEHKSTQDNIKELESFSVDPNKVLKLRIDIIMGYSSSTLLALKIYGDLIKKFGSKVNNILPGMESITAKLGIKQVNQLILNNLKIINKALGVIGILGNIKDLFFSAIDIKKGYSVSGFFGLGSVSLAILAPFAIAGPLGLVGALVLAGLSILCAVLSEYYRLTPMEIWFDRCAFGLREINDGSKQPYPLTLVGLKQAMNDFLICVQGIKVNLKLQYSTIMGMDYDAPTVMLVMEVPNFNDTTSKYDGLVIIDDSTSSQQTMISFNGNGEDFEMTNPAVQQTNGLSPINTLITTITNENESSSNEDESSSKEVMILDKTVVTDQENDSNIPTQQIGTLVVNKKLVKLPSTNGLKVRLFLNYIADTTKKNEEPLTIEDQLVTSSVLNTVIYETPEPIMY